MGPSTKLPFSAVNNDISYEPDACVVYIIISVIINIIIIIIVDVLQAVLTVTEIPFYREEPIRIAGGFNGSLRTQPTRNGLQIFISLKHSS